MAGNRNHNSKLDFTNLDIINNFLFQITITLMAMLYLKLLIFGMLNSEKIYGLTDKVFIPV